MQRNEIADLIFLKLKSLSEELQKQYEHTNKEIGHFVIDNLLPAEIANKFYSAFPDPKLMRMKKSLKEYKYIAAQMNQYNPLLEEAIFAFQDSRIVKLISDICKISDLHPDENLYAGGISLMGNNQYLNPHLDNSHDKDKNKWRVLNLLYYVTPNWDETYGGNLELWPNGVGKKQISIHSKFNRLIVMATHNGSWHSVSPIRQDYKRCCVSNYYFSDNPLRAEDTFHITTFRGRPEQKIQDLFIRADIMARSAVRRVVSNKLIQNPHVYKK